MIPLIWQEIRTHRIAVFIYAAIGLAFLAMYVSLFPSLKIQSEAYTQIFQSMPKGFMEAFGVEVDSFTRLEGFISAEYFSLTWPLLLILLALSQASSAVSGEIEKGTMRSLLSLPVSRIRILSAKFLASAITLAVFVAVSVLGIIPLAAAYNLHIDAIRVISLAGIGWLFGMTVFSTALLLSALFSDRGKVSLTASGLLMLMYVANILSGLKDNLRWLEHYSIFHYFNPGEILVHGTINSTAAWLFLSITLISLTAGLYWFNRRDISA